MLENVGYPCPSNPRKQTNVFPLSQHLLLGECNNTLTPAFISSSGLGQPPPPTCEPWNGIQTLALVRVALKAHAQLALFTVIEFDPGCGSGVLRDPP